MKKIISLLLVIITLSLTLCSCAPDFSEEDALGYVKDLLEREIELTPYLYGHAFETEKDPSAVLDSKASMYFEVRSDMPYRKLEELIEKVDGIYSKELREAIYEYAFTGNDFYRPRFANTTKGVLQIDVTNKGYDLTAELDMSTLRIKRMTNSIIEAKVDYVAGKNKTERTMTVKLVREGGQWYLDMQTWAVSIKENG